MFTNSVDSMDTSKVEVDADNMVSIVLRKLRQRKSIPNSQTIASETVLTEEKWRRIYSLSEVAEHDSYDDCWIVLYDRVYNMTPFLDEHPGGAEMLMEYGGRDASVAFRGHSRAAMDQLKMYEIGELPEKERIYRRVGMFKSSELPE